MAMYRFHVKHIGRTTHTTPVAKHVAYILREDDYGPASAHVRYLTREAANVKSREDLAHSEWHNLPSWADNKPAQFFAAAEEYERSNGRLSTTWEIALPRELPRPQQITAVRDFLDTQIAKQPYAWALHDSKASDNGMNPHVHVIFSSRTIDGIHREADQFFKRYNPEHPEEGGARKDTSTHDRRAIALQRQVWSDIANWHLERAGVDERIDPRSLKDRGIDREPETRLTKLQAATVKYRGLDSPIWDEKIRYRSEAAQSKPEEHRMAWAYWEQRKVVLGITPATSREEFLRIVTTQEPPNLKQYRADVVPGDITGATERLSRHVTYLERLEQEHALQEQRLRDRQPDSAADVQRVAVLLKSPEAFDDAVTSPGARVRIRSKERGFDAGF
jgi:hypothetical protein